MRDGSERSLPFLRFCRNFNEYGLRLCMNFCVESAIVHYCIAYFTIKTMNLHIFCKFIDSILIIL